jgi:polyhydroxybutyrate depolymerase
LPSICSFSPGETTRTVTVGRRERRYILYVPPNFGDSSTGAGNATSDRVLFAFHGGGGDPLQFINQTQLEPLADLHKFILVFPYGTPSLPLQPDKLLSWNAGFCCGDAVSENVDDLSFVQAIKSDIVKLYGSINPFVTATGFSNGALLIENLTYRDPSLFRKIVSVAGTYKGVASNEDNPSLPADPVLGSILATDVLLIHGVEDPNILYLGGKQQDALSATTTPIFVPSFEEGFNFWQRASGCQNITNIGTITQEITIKYQRCGSVDLAAIIGKSAQHVWPGDPNKLTGVQSFPYIDFSASDALWNFIGTCPSVASVAPSTSPTTLRSQIPQSAITEASQNRSLPCPRPVAKTPEQSPVLPLLLLLGLFLLRRTQIS